MLEFAEYLVIAAIVFTVLALVASIAHVTATRRQPAVVTRSRAMVAVGDGPAETMTADDAAASSPAGSGGRRSSVGWYAAAFEVIALALLTAYMVVRMSVTGHGPFANQHEFAVAFTWGILLVNLLFVLRYRIRMLSLIVMPVAAVLLTYAMTLDTGVRPLIPALQNNLLLTLHVSFAIIAYGAACVSFGSAVLYLIHPHVRRVKLPKLELLDDIGYRAAVITFPLLTIMIALGSVWANTAWGRYWGWDPKETAALVTWLVYGAFLHARVVRDWRGRKAAWLLVLGFLTVLFAYFGNHFFGGLHSYA